MTDATQAAPRQAQDSEQDTRLTLAVERLRDAQMSVDLDTRIPGLGIRLMLDTYGYLIEPQEAHDLAVVLEAVAQDAIHADRAGRR